MSLANFLTAIDLGHLTEKMIENKNNSSMSNDSVKEREYIPERDYIDYEAVNAKEKSENTVREIKAAQEYLKSKNYKQ